MSMSLRASLLCLLSLVVSPVWAAIEAPVYGTGDLDGGSWSAGGGSRLITGPLQCVYSTSNKNKVDRGKATVYQLRASVQGGSQAAFVMRNQAGGSSVLPFQLSYQSSGNKEALGYNAWSGQFNGVVDNGSGCGGGAGNERLLVDIAAADLKLAESGTYRATLQLEYLGGQNLSQTDSATVDVSITIVSYGIQIKNLGNIDLGNWDGVSTEVGRNEPFCLASNDYIRDMKITASSANGSNGSFAMGGAGSSINYRVFMATNTSASPTSMELVDRQSQNFNMNYLELLSC